MREPAFDEDEYGNSLEDMPIEKMSISHWIVAALAFGFVSSAIIISLLMAIGLI